MGGSGYACLLQKQMQSWREAWSVVPGTTSPNAPFGIVMLADGTDEGWGCNTLQMHWAETGNHGVVPNPAFPHAFVAAAHDLGEPWDDGCKKSAPYCCVAAVPTAGRPNAGTRDPSCGAGDPRGMQQKWLINHNPRSVLVYPLLVLVCPLLGSSAHFWCSSAHFWLVNHNRRDANWAMTSELRVCTFAFAAQFTLIGFLPYRRHF